jgi:glyoxylase-like metal-dependent hydrolase (beta-lactamase superfamily II)
MRVEDVRRLLLGTFVRPPEETGGEPRVEAVYAYAVPHARGLVLLDTGIGASDEETEAWYRPRRIPLQAALHQHGWTQDDVHLVVNCHLHFDHCGGNPLFPTTRIVAQREELATARRGGYTVEALVEGGTYEELDGEAEVLPGVHVIPTPGHTDGHQSLAVVCDDGSIVLAGQSHDQASQWSADVLASEARQLGLDEPLPTYPAWVDRLKQFDPRRVVFAHDAAVWTPDGR